MTTFDESKQATDTKMKKERKQMLTEIPVVVVFLLTTMGAIAKLIAPPSMVAHYAQLGLVPYLEALGISELMLAALFVNRATGRLGFFLLTAYLGGAIATELRQGAAIMGPVVMLALVWVAAYLRDAALFSRPKDPAQGASVPKLPA
jgi:hypothetical protein